MSRRRGQPSSRHCVNGLTDCASNTKDATQNHVRTAQHVIVQGLSLDVPDNPIAFAARARAVGLSEQTGPAMMAQERVRHDDFFSGDGASLLVLRGAERTDKNPSEWEVYVAATWLDASVTRPSETKKGARNPLDRND